MPVKRFDKTPMPVQEAEERAHNFVEVNEGYTDAHARFEAERCMRCQDPICVSGCPVGVPIPQFIHAVAMGDMQGASCWETDLRQPLTLIIGGEAEGASPQARALASQSICIPMAGGSESLNAAVAGSVLMFEVMRQRKGK